jgi:hypothetical protein
MMRKLEVAIIPPQRRANEEAGDAHYPTSKKSE